ncbi:MAG: DUF2490 domain-containing protein [Planctomycetota bacterium]
MLARSLLPVLLILLLPLGVAHAEDLDHEVEVWLPVSAQGDLIDETFGGYIEVQPRVSREGLDRLLVRPAAYLRVAERLSVWLGYAWTPGFEPVHQDEHRIWEQFLAEFHLDDLADPSPVLSSRTRLEQRFIESVPDVAVRLRQLIRLQVPVYELVSAVVWDEVFVNLNDTRGGPRLGFDQNRLFVGVNLAFVKEVSLDVGYLNVHQHRGAGEVDLVRHVVMAWLMFRF